MCLKIVRFCDIIHKEKVQLVKCFSQVEKEKSLYEQGIYHGSTVNLDLQLHGGIKILTVELEFAKII